MQDGEVIVIDNPKVSPICKECCRAGNCNEFGEICCPIVCDGKSYGVIGLIAFSEEQRKIIETNSDGMVNFLTRMADLLSGKLKAAIKSYELDIEKKKLETLVDGMDKSVVSIDVDGRIDRYNLKFKKMFNIKDDITGKIIFDIFKFIGKSYGVIRLIAFSEEQSNKIQTNSYVMVNFLTRMADLMSGKLKAAIKSYELDIEKKKLETLVDGMDKSVVSIDVDGRIDRYNLKFKKMFNIKDDITGKIIFDIFKFIKIPDKYRKGHSFSASFNYKGGGKSIKGIYNMSRIELNGEIKGYVIDFTDKKEAIKNYNKMNKDRSIMIDNIIGESEAIKKVKKETIMAAQSVSTVLITGESGTGKELFARAIHNHSKRAEYPFIAVNCAAIPDNLLESELFGYEEGAFTGARKGGKLGMFEIAHKGSLFLDEIGDMSLHLQSKLLRVLQDEEGAFTGARKGGKLGMFEIAHKGSLFLDEIGDMSLHLQSKLLRVLQEKEVNKIGAKSNIEIDVRIIAATNKDLESMVKEGTFREDLYYRLNVIPIKLPSLSQRKGDIPLLIDYMIREYSVKLEKNVEGIDEVALDRMQKYGWPGNVRELQNSIEYSVNMAQGREITVDVLPKSILEYEEKFEEDETSAIETLEDLEKREIKKALKRYGVYKKDKELAAKALGISRATLYRKIEKYGIK